MRRLELFPLTTKIENDSLTIAGHALPALVQQYDTPLYLYDRRTMDAAVREYKVALDENYPAASGITYAAKAFFCKAIAQWTQSQALRVDCTGASEIAIAMAAGVPKENILVHGVNKSQSDLESACAHAGTIVVDHLSELRKLPLVARTVRGPGAIWFRILPGLAVQTHHKHTQTGQHDSKFGMTRDEILQAAAFCKANDLPLKGLHFHQGSNFRDPEPLLPAIEMALDLAKEIGLAGDWDFCPGGGWGAAYHEDELPHPDIESYVRGIATALVDGCRARDLDLPRLHLEPGRSIIARAGVAIYRIGTIKRRAEKIWILTDGGLADNPRPALYGARYSSLPAAGLAREFDQKVSIAGPYCESGDILIEDLRMPRLEEGELLAIPMAGAYHLSMASNYNGARRPAVLWLEAGAARLIVQRETVDALMQRDVSL